MKTRDYPCRVSAAIDTMWHISVTRLDASRVHSLASYIPLESAAPVSHEQRRTVIMHTTAPKPVTEANVTF